MSKELKIGLQLGKIRAKLEGFNEQLVALAKQAMGPLQSHEQRLGEVENRLAALAARLEDVAADVKRLTPHDRPEAGPG